MKTNSLTHDAISQRAREIWQAEGNPHGRDTEIWLNAEQQLSTSPKQKNPKPDARSSYASATETGRIISETAAESIVEYNISPPISEEAAVNAALQTQGPPGTTAAKPAPQSVPAMQVRGSGQSQSTATPAADPKPADPAPEPLSAHLPATPAEIAAPEPQQKKAARTPHVARRTGPKQTPPESGKPVSAKPPSS